MDGRDKDDYFGVFVIIDFSTEFAGEHEQLDGQKCCTVVQRCTTELSNAILGYLQRIG